MDSLDDHKHAAAITLHHFGQDGGYPAGDFATALIVAMCKADGENLARLMKVFPVLGGAVTVAKYHPNGITMLQRNAKGAAA